MSVPYAIFASGSGSNALSLMEEGKRLGQKPAFVLCNVADAPVMAKARASGVKVVFIESKCGASEASFEQAALDALKEHNVQWIFLAGFMKILSHNFLRQFKSNDSFDYFQVVNIHPSLLPDFPGLRGYEKAYASEKEEFGFTVHLVDEKVDHGPFLLQYILKRKNDDTEESFKKRGLRFENEYYPQVLSEILKRGHTYIAEQLNGHQIIKE